MYENKPNPLLLWLQLSGGAFPTGSFNHSYGLETYIQDGLARTVNDVEQLLGAYIELTLATDAVFVKEAYNAAIEGDALRLQALQEWYGALKTARETYEASLKTGRSLLLGVKPLFEGAEPELYGRLPDPSCAYHYAVAYGIVSAMLELPPDDAILTYTYSGAASLVAVAARIMPLGQTESQLVLFRLNRRLNERGFDLDGLRLDRLQTFSPSFEIASMRHETLYTRLCMS